jgi:hypothetical protein
VPEGKDPLRRKSPRLYALYDPQYRLCFYSAAEEERFSKRVFRILNLQGFSANYLGVARNILRLSRNGWGKWRPCLVLRVSWLARKLSGETPDYQTNRWETYPTRQSQSMPKLHPLPTQAVMCRRTKTPEQTCMVLRRVTIVRGALRWTKKETETKNHVHQKMSRIVLAISCIRSGQIRTRPERLEVSCHQPDFQYSPPRAYVRYIHPMPPISCLQVWLEWVIEKTGNTKFKDTMYAAALDENKPDYWKSEAFSHIFSRPIFRPLPPKEEAFLAVKEFFKDFNSVCPLFSQPTFMDFLERQYTQDPPNSVGWWASLNVVLAITYCLQSLNNAPPEVNEKAWDYFRNALAVLTELTIRSSDLFGVQALLGMALFMQGTADPRPSAFLVTSAMRLSHTLGLHKKESGFNLEPMEAEQRKRVFWIAYRIDKDMCIRSGLPLIQDDDDMNLELPDEDPEDGFGNMMHSGGQGKINIFRLMAEFAHIEGRVHKQLYSTKASKQSDQELLITIGELEPEYEIRVEHAPLSLHIIVLHFAYYNCLTMIHRTSVNHSYWTSRSSNAIFHGFEPLNPRVFASATLCSTAARASIRLIKYIPIQDMGFV